MNALVGEKLSIITSKAQTTRHRIMGIVNGEGFQIVYSDTPGILKPNYKLQESMMKSIRTALTDADILVYITDVVEKIDKNPDMLRRIGKMKIPVLTVINKIDLSTQEEVEEMIQKWQALLPEAEIIPMSAIKNFNIEKLLHRIVELLPEGPPYFPKDQLTDKTERFFVSEIIREKILIRYRKEIPYSVEIEVESFIEEKEIIEHHYYHIGVAVGTERGLVVPVIRHADKLSFAELEKAIVDYVKKINDNRLTLSDLEGGTFTISNGGVYGSLLSTPILNMPQSGILGMHKIEKRPVVINDEIVVRPMMYIALSYDHRIVDGREAVTFLKRIKECVENPERIMMEI